MPDKILSFGLVGSIYQMLSHGLVSAALFLCVGVIYDRYHTRVIFYYSGLCVGLALKRGRGISSPAQHNQVDF